MIWFCYLAPFSYKDAQIERAGWQRGYCFSSGEVVNLLNTRQAANDDLSDEQLDMVVGGVSPVDREINAFIGEMTQFWSKPII